MGLPDGRKSFWDRFSRFDTIPAVTDTQPATQQDSHVAVAITLNAKASSLKTLAGICSGRRIMWIELVLLVSFLTYSMLKNVAALIWKTEVTQRQPVITTFKTFCMRAAAMICLHSGLQVETRYTSCTHMDMPKLLYVHVGLPVELTEDAW